MTLSRFVYKTHKWLAVGALIATLAWFVSGIIMVTPNRLFGSRAFQYKGQPGDRTLRDVTISIAQAIAIVDAAAGAPAKLEDVRLRRLAGRLVYEISTDSGKHLVDAVDGSRVAIDEEFAKHIVKRHVGEGARFRDVSLLRVHNDEYGWGPVPAWRIALDDDRATLFFIGAQGGEVSYSDRYGRARQWLIGWHSLAFLNGLFSTRVIQGIMWLFSVVGTAMSFFGCWILWIQWKNWLAARRARPAHAD
jgi:hypothetical protein